MSQESKTPRTDAEAAEAAKYASISKGWYVHADFARQLETELAAMTEERDALIADKRIKEANMKTDWIRSSERLPDVGQKVLGFWPEAMAGLQVREMRYGIPRTHKRPYWLWNNRVVRAGISHWMPLPEPPSDSDQ